MSPTPLSTTPTTTRACPVVRSLQLPLEKDRTLRLRLHLEGESVYGSIKARTAHALLTSLETRGLLQRGGRVIESTSGNLGIALAGLCAERGYRCTLMVDEATSLFSLQRMTDLGAQVIYVRAPDPAHAVRARIAAVHQFLIDYPGAVWTDQYSNPAGPAIHARHTGPALLHHAGLAHPDAVVVPVSTGGTMAGVATYVRQHDPSVQIWAADAVGSAASGGSPSPRPDKLPGFGSGLPSRFLTPSHLDHTARVSDADAALACRIVHARTGVWLGGSAGATVVAAVRAAHLTPTLTDVACLCPDGGDRYQTTIYAPEHMLPAPNQLSAFADLAALYRLRLENGRL
ncbi:pyridoxal-phosphate dependent enzyme [Streptosporangium canum]|uniref:pyridoxal-phosphate dependent enzyme n=1 Tax=Streptosporangium canum TaxID=324952 RepID=UPI0036A43C3A